MGTRENPYVGPSPFEQTDAPFFYGRDGEANELFSLICAHSVVLCYSQSGAGKTSLLNARIIPRLKEQQAEVLGVVRIGVKLPKDAQEKKIANVFVFNTLLSLQGDHEEFTLDRLSQMSLVEYLQQRKPEGEYEDLYPIRVMIFDQFEELFTSFPEHWEKRENFFLSINQALEVDPFLRVVFAMREEYIAKLDPFAPMLPQRLQKRFRLERLRKEAAIRAVEGPLERMREFQDPLERTQRTYGPNVVEKLVDNLLQEQIKHRGGTVSTTGEFVEPVQLQIVCHSLWEELPDDVKVIDKRAVAKFGDVDTALAKYYDDSLKKVVSTNKVDEGGLRLWFGRALITPVGTRATVYMDEGRTEDNLSESVVNMLEERRLIRPELRGGAKWYELTHDRFIEPILRSNQKWLGLLPADKTFLNELEKKAAKWELNGKPGAELLPDEELRAVTMIRERRTKLRKATESETLKKYISESEVASRRRKLYWSILYVAIIPIIGLVLISTTIFSSLKARRATSERRMKQVQRGEEAKAFAGVKGREYSALALGIEGVGLSEPSDAPPEAVEGLRASLTTIDNKVWLRESDTIPAPNRLELTTDGRLALAVNNNELCVWNTVTGQKTFDCYPRPEAAEWSQVDFFPDSELLFVVFSPIAITRADSPSKVNQWVDNAKVEGSVERKVLIFNARTGDQLKELQEELKGAWGLQISDDGKHILADFRDRIKIVNVDSQNVSAPTSASQPQWLQIALSPDGSRLVAIYDGTKVEILEAQSGRVIGSFTLGIARTGGLWDSIGFSHDRQRGVLVRSSGRESVGIVWDSINGQRLTTFKSKIGNVEDVAFSADDRSVVVFGDARLETLDAAGRAIQSSTLPQADIFDISTGNLSQSHHFPHGEITRHSGTYFLSIQKGNDMSSVSVWDALTGVAKESMDVSKYIVTKAALSPDAAKVVTVSEDNVIVAWTVGPSPQIESLSPVALLSYACGTLQPQKEYIQVSGICKEYHPIP